MRKNDLKPILVMLSKAGLEVPTGANIMGVMNITPGIELINDDYGEGLGWDTRAKHHWDARREIVTIKSEPVFVDDDDHTWVIGGDGRWQPAGVQLTFEASNTLAEHKGEDEPAPTLAGE
jgi:hypothetical protein